MFAVLGLLSLLRVAGVVGAGADVRVAGATVTLAGAFGAVLSDGAGRFEVGAGPDRGGGRLRVGYLSLDKSMALRSFGGAGNRCFGWGMPSTRLCGPIRWAGERADGRA